MQKDWEQWKEIFTATVIEDQSLKDVQKVHLLSNAMDDKAKSVLKGTRMTAGNFQTAWEKLLRRFDDKDVRLYSHLEEIINAPRMTKKSSEELSPLIDLAAESFKGLEELGCPVEHYDVWYIHCIVKKLDNETRESWNIRRESLTGLPTYKGLIEFLENRMHSLDQSQIGSDLTLSSKKLPTNPKIQSHAVAAVKSKSCPICGGTHSVFGCLKFRNQSVEERRTQVGKLQLCFNCLQRKHLVKDCTSKGSCAVCSEKHHTLLHRDLTFKRQKHSMGSNKDNLESSEPPVQNNSEFLPRNDENFKNSKSTHATYSAIFADVLLANAKVILQSCDR